MDLSKCTIDYIKTCNNDIFGMKSAYLSLLCFSLIFSVFININEYANYANMITWIFYHVIKELRLSFYLVQILVKYG